MYHGTGDNILTLPEPNPFLTCSEKRQSVVSVLDNLWFSCQRSDSSAGQPIERLGEWWPWLCQCRLSESIRLGIASAFLGEIKGFRKAQVRSRTRKDPSSGPKSCRTPGFFSRHAGRVSAWNSTGRRRGIQRLLASPSRSSAPGRNCSGRPPPACRP